MDNTPNYRQLSPPTEKQPEEYTWAERRGEIHDMIERAGHYRNIEYSQRELADRYGVVHRTVQKDIDAVNEWIAQHLGAGAKAELDTLKTRAVLDLIEEGDTAEAYELMRRHYKTLMAAGVKEKAPEKSQVDLNGELTQTHEIGDEARATALDVVRELQEREADE